MPDDEPRPQPIVLRIKLRYEDADAMAQRFAANVGRAGLFLPTKSIQPIGSELKFELRLANDTPVLVGLGRVRAAREPDPARPRAAFGISVELLRVTREGRALILKMLDRRRELGLPDLAIPMPEDIDTARRIEADAAGARLDSGPVRQQDLSGQVVRGDGARVHGSVVAPVPPEPAQAEPLLTSPRRPTGPIGVAKVDPSRFVVAALAAEPVRRPRPRVQDVMEMDSARVELPVLPELDEAVDVEQAVLRARALAAGGDLDAELDALAEAAAVPMPVDVDAVSAELSLRLGGVAVVRRDRSGGWAPPPPVAVVEPVAAVEPVTEPAPALVAAEPAPEPEPEPEPEPVVARPEPSVVEDAAALVEAEVDADEPADLPVLGSSDTPQVAFSLPDEAPDPSQLMIHDHADAARFAGEHGALADDEQELGDDDLQEVEHTVIGAMPAIADEVSERLDAQLAEVEEDAASDLRMSRDAALATDEPVEDEGPTIHPLVAAPTDDDEPPEPGTTDDDDPAEPGTTDDDDPAEPGTTDDDDGEPIDDFEILAEADADDADLLASDGEADASAEHFAAPEPTPTPAPAPARRHATPVPVRASVSRTSAPRGASPQFDYGRLDLGEDSGMIEAAPADYELDRALETDSDRPSNFTIEAAPAPSGHDPDFDEPHAAFTATNFDADELIAALQRPTAIPTGDEPRLLRTPPAPSPSDLDLDSALQELDVSFDDPREARTVRSAPRPATGRPGAKQPPRAVSEGVLIDFDDDDESR